LISYLQIYYCSLQDAQPIAFLIFVLWAGLLFSTIGIAASDFLCINLSTIANILGMSESLTGVTFLAFGNGSPDVFSTFAAMRSNSGSLAVGELVGAASFISAVVAGSMALVAPFQVAKRSFIRDVGFFAVAASFSMVFLADGRLLLWECITMIVYYVFYVIFVVLWHWWLTRRRIRRQAETAARLVHHIPDQQELEAPEVEDDEESRPASERTNLLRLPSSDSVPTLLTPGTPAWTVQDLDDDDEARDRYLAELQSKMRVSRPHRGERRNTMTPIRPSLIGALEFRSVMSSLERKATSTQPIGLRRYSDDASASGTPIPISAPPGASQPELAANNLLDLESGSPRRARAVSANDATHLRIDTDFLSDRRSSGGSEAVLTSGEPSPNPAAKHSRPSANILRSLNEPSGKRPPSPKLVVSPSGRQAPESGSLGSNTPKSSAGLLAPPPTTFHRPDYRDNQHTDHGNNALSPALSPRSAPRLEVPILHTPHPDHSKGALTREDFPPYVDSPMVLTPVGSRPPSIHMPAPSMSPESTAHLGLLPDEEEEEQLRIFSWWPYQYLPAPQRILEVLFPTLYDWRNKTHIDRILGLITAPSVFLLTITLPIVEAKNGGAVDPDPGLLTPIRGHSRANTLDLNGDAPAKANLSAVSPHPHETGRSRQMSDYIKTPAPELDELEGPKGWNRWLVFLQLFTAPFFVVTITWANMEDDITVSLYVRMVLGALIFSLLSLLVLLALTSPDREPKYRPLLCFLGFAVAIGWISTIANEVVGLLKAFGVILGMSDAILGLTIFAVGNSCGDLVADITVAKLGYPVMALSACFGGPMLNILLGIGIGGMYMTISRADHRHHKHPSKPIKYKPYEIDVSTTLMISGITLLVTLIGLLVVVPLNGWRMDKRVGLGLIVLWSLSTVGNVIVEVLGYGGDTG
jgi:solute carrier family 24 (sodium/potassium/calcium exchanger), member 6